MVDRNGSEFDAWKAFHETSNEFSSDALLNLYADLDSLGSRDSISAGLAAFDKLLEENRYERAAFLARCIATEFTNLAKFAEGAEIIDRALEFDLWLSEFEVGMLYYVRGGLHAAQNELAESEFVLEQSTLLLEAESERLAGFAFKELADVRLRLENNEGTVAALTRAISLLEGCGEVRMVGQAKRQFGEVLQSQGQFRMAEKYLREAVAISEFTDWLEESCCAELSLGRVLAQLGEFEESANIFDRLIARRSETNLIKISAEAAYHAYQLKIVTNAVDHGDRQVEDLKAILSAVGLLVLADSLAGQNAVVRDGPEDC